MSDLVKPVSGTEFTISELTSLGNSIIVYHSIMSISGSDSFFIKENSALAMLFSQQTYTYRALVETQHSTSLL